MSALTVVAASALTELDPKLRTAFDLTHACAVRLEVAVTTPVPGAELVLCYSLSNGLFWNLLSASGTGPVVAVGVAGDRRGVFLNVRTDAKADVLLSPFVRGGDDVTSLVLGDLNAMVRLRTSFSPCEVIAE